MTLGIKCHGSPWEKRNCERSSRFPSSSDLMDLWKSRGWNETCGCSRCCLPPRKYSSLQLAFRKPSNYCLMWNWLVMKCRAEYPSLSSQTMRPSLWDVNYKRASTGREMISWRAPSATKTPLPFFLSAAGQTHWRWRRSAGGEWCGCCISGCRQQVFP